MCWKHELAKAHNNMTRAILYLGRVRNRRTWADVTDLTKSTEVMIDQLDEMRIEIRRLIKEHAISRKPYSKSFSRLMGEAWYDEEKHSRVLK